MKIKSIHNLRGRIASLIVLMGLLFIASQIKADQWGDWTYTTDGSNVTITGYARTKGDVVVPDVISNMPVVAIGDYAFEADVNLTNVAISSSITSIGIYSFLDCLELTNITTPDSITSIGEGAFQSCHKLKIAPIGRCVSSIGDTAFYYCTSLTSVTLSNSLNSIGRSSFFGCLNLTNVTIACSVTNIGSNPFGYCVRLPAIEVDEGNPAFKSMDGVLYDKNMTTLIQYPGNKLGAVVIPNTITNIRDGAFCGSLSLTNITIPESVIDIGQMAFSSCPSCTGIYFNGSSPRIGPIPFTHTDNATVYFYPWTSGWTDTYGGRPTQVNPAYSQWLLDYSFATNMTEDSTDYDHDGMLNWQEYLSGTNPTNASDKLAIISMGGTNGSLISWQAKSNVSYQVMRSLNLLGGVAAWSNASSGIGSNQQSYQTAPADGLLQYADPNVAEMTNAFYRVIVVQ